jgi:hypothetical protein
MASVTLALGTSIFEVPSQAFHRNSSLLIDRPNLQTYSVHTQVSPQLFLDFIRALEEGSDLSITPDNVAQVELLCEEFGAARLKRLCEQFADQQSTGATHFRLQTTELQFEEKVTSLVSTVGELKSEFVLMKDSFTKECRGLRGELRMLKDSIGDLRVSEELKKLKSQTETSGSGLANLRGEFDQLRVVLQGLQQDFQLRFPTFPLNLPGSVDGIISYLEKKHGGNIHNKGIVTITSNSASDSDSPPHRQLGTATWLGLWQSDEVPDRCVCWDFRALRILPTHYTIWGSWLKSWVVEGSLDGRLWTPRDQQADSNDFEGCAKATFAVSNSAECRFIRLTQSGENVYGCFCLHLGFVEFFGGLSV